MDLDSLGSVDSSGFDQMESLLAYTVDKRQRNAEAASPELRKEAILSNTVKRAHRLLSMSHDDKISSFLSDDSFSDSDNHDEHIDVTNQDSIDKSTQQVCRPIISQQVNEHDEYCIMFSCKILTQFMIINRFKIKIQIKIKIINVNVLMNRKSAVPVGMLKWCKLHLR
jgi:hypothetical protein